MDVFGGFDFNLSVRGCAISTAPQLSRTIGKWESRTSRRNVPSPDSEPTAAILIADRQDAIAARIAGDCLWSNVYDEAKGRIMVWGMLLPAGFGEFWPLGDFEGRIEPGSSGWGERLKRYYNGKALEEQTSLFVGLDAHLYPSYVSGKLSSEIGTSDGPHNPTYNSIKPHEPPEFFQTEKRYSELGSIIELTNRIVAIDSAMKALIERIEPEIHQFFPIRIIMPRDVAFPKNYYVLVVGRYNDSFSPENCTTGSWRENGGAGFYAIDKSATGVRGLAFSKAAYGNSHLWRDRSIGKGLTFLSDELNSAIDNAGLRIPKHYRVKEV